MAVGDNQDEVMDADDVQVMLADGRLKPADPDLGYPNSGTEVIHRADYEQGIRHVDMSASGIATNEAMTYGEMIAYRSLAPMPQEATPGLTGVTDESASNFDYTLQVHVSNPASAQSAWSIEVWRALGQLGQEGSYSLIATPGCVGPSTTQLYNDKPVTFAQYYCYKVRYTDGTNVGPFSAAVQGRATTAHKTPA